MRELASSLAPVNTRLLAEDSKRPLHDLREREELVGDLDPRGDPVDDLASHSLGIGCGLEPVLESRDSVGDVAGLVTTREQHDPPGGVVRREIVNDLEDVEDLTFAEDVKQQ